MTKHGNTCNESVHNETFYCENRPSVLEQYQTDSFFNDFILKREWKQLYVDEDTDYYDVRDVHLQILSGELIETGLSTTYVHISKNCLLKTNHLPLSSPSKMIKNLQRRHVHHN